MDDFIFHNPVRIIFGKNAMAELGSHVAKFGKRVFITYGQGSIKKNGIYEEVMAKLKNCEIVEFGGIEPNPRVETLRKAIEEVRKFNPDLILAVGGGSVIDGTKLIAAATHYEGDAWDFLVKPGVEPTSYVPFAVVLTLSSTNSETNSGAVITNWTTHEKLFFEREQTFPQFAIMNPEFTYTLPQEQVAVSVIDPFVHVMEQYINTTSGADVQDRLAEGLLHSIIDNAPKALQNKTDYQARANLMLAGTLVLNGLISSGVGQDWATHNIEHEVSAFYDITHALGLAVILPRWLEVVAKEQKSAKLVQYGKRIWGLSGSDEEIMQAAIQKTYDFFKSLGVKMTLSEYGVSDEHFPTMVERLSSTKTGEIALTAVQIDAILRKSL